MRSDDVLPYRLSREEIVDLIDQHARRRLGISAEELLQTYLYGQLTDRGKVSDLLVLASLLPPDDPLLGGHHEEEG